MVSRLYWMSFRDGRLPNGRVSVALVGRSWDLPFWLAPRCHPARPSAPLTIITTHTHTHTRAFTPTRINTQLVIIVAARLSGAVRAVIAAGLVGDGELL